MRGEHRQSGILERDQAHEHVAVRTLAADFLGVDACGLVAMVAVGYEQLGVGECVVDSGDRFCVVDAPDAVDGAVVVGRLAPGCGRGGCVREHAGCGSGRVVVEREDRGEVGFRRPGEVQPVLLRAGVGPLVGSDPSRPIVLHAHAREKPGTPTDLPVGPRVVLLDRPKRGSLVLNDHSLVAPRRKQPCRVAVRVVADRQVDPHHVVGRSGFELRPLLGVDHVIGRGHHVLEAAGSVQVVVQRPQRFDIGHAGAGGYRLGADVGSRSVRGRSIGAPGFEPGTSSTQSLRANQAALRPVSLGAECKAVRGAGARRFP